MDAERAQRQQLRPASVNQTDLHALQCSYLAAHCITVSLCCATPDLTTHGWLIWSRQVFHTAQLFLVYGTGSSDPAYNELMRNRARFIANAAYYQGRAAITILDDQHPMVDQLIEGDEQRSNVRTAVLSDGTVLCVLLQRSNG